MLQLGRYVCVTLLGAAMQLGCRDNTPPVPAVAPPAPGQDTFRRDYEPVKPLPPQGPDAVPGPTPFADEPLLIDTPPEAGRYVEVYRQVGRPRLVVFVNRTIEGQLIPSGGGEYTDRTVEYLQPGEYDEVQAKAIDYGMMETLLTDWLSADGKVMMVSPLLARKKLTDAQINDLQKGRQQMMQEVAEQLDADVLIQVQARITKQSAAGQSVRIVAEAMNTRGGDSLARATVDMDPPLAKAQLNKYTRFLSRKLMDGMASTWSNPATKDRPAPSQPPAAQSPSPEPSGSPSPDKGLGPRLDAAPARARAQP